MGLALLALGVACLARLVRFSTNRQRKKAGLGAGKTISQDNVTLRSERLGLSGTPDQIVKIRGVYIPEEKKTSTRIYGTHTIQLGVYFLLIEEQYGVRPPYGFIVLGGGKRVKVSHTDRLRRPVLKTAEQMRHARTHPKRKLSPPNASAQCRACRQRPHCSIRLA